MADNNNPSLESLAATVSETANALSAKLKESACPAPSFAEDGLVEYPKLPELNGLRFQLIDAAADLYRLALGPTDNSMFAPLHLNYDATVIDVLNHFDIWNAVPVGGSASYSEIATKVNLPESLVRRILKYAITIRYFARDPSDKDRVVHTSLSAVPAKQYLIRSWFRHHFDEARVAGRGAHRESLSLANVDKLKTPESFWDYLNREAEGKPKGWRATNFAESMQAASSASAIRAEDLLNIGYDWAQLGDVTLVDVGGSSGHDAVHLARTFPNLKKIVVQDLPEVQTAFDERLPEELKSRVSFEPHDFFGPQNTPGDVYMLKTILHDWPDKYAAKILANLVPRLKSGSRILLVEAVGLLEGVEPPFQMLGRTFAAADLHMLGVFNSLERNLEDWKTLLGDVDERLEIGHVSQVLGALHNFIEIKFRG
ncbi:Winged helix-like DNA-binding domain superfamily [Fusarium oxysporum f. sp. vasinfectum]|nr:Winged helix-like DNA-binding domain superfamily [Fusarium oxysporum f. sp. vasinfectum]